MPSRPAPLVRSRLLVVVWLLIAAPAAQVLPVAAAEPFQAFPLANLNRTFDASTLPQVEAPVAVAHGLVFTWSGELWVTDGTALGTRRLCGPNPDLCVRVAKRLVSPPDLLYFLDDRLQPDDRALWRTDGTEAGTFPVTSPDRIRVQYRDVYDSHLQALSGRLFFVAEDLEARTGFELWLTDGTVAGTRQVLDIADDPGEVGSAPFFGDDLGPRVVFSANTSQELWATDGSSEGTFKLFVTNEYIFGITTPGDQVVFFTTKGFGDSTLWRSDGLRSGTTERIRELVQPQSLPIGPYIDAVGPVLGDRVLFFLGGLPWATDGTAAGTGPLTELTHNNFGFPPLALAGKRGIFPVDTGGEGDQVWVTDGTRQGTRLLVDPCPGRCLARPGGFFPVGNQVVFSMDDGLAGREPWITDGTPSGTQRLADLCPGSCGSRPVVIGTLGGVLWVSADGGDGRELWRVRLTGGQAFKLTDLDLADPFTGAPDGGLVNGKLVFPALSPAQGEALWASDGTGPGTRPYFTLVEPADGGSSPSSFTRRGSEIFFGAHTPEPGLWATDGSGTGTRLVWTAPEGVARIGRIVRLDDPRKTLLFTTEGTETDRIDLYRSDGTAEGTVRLAADIDRAGGARSPLVKAGDRVFYLAAGNPRPWKDAGIWVSDGTVERTRRILALPGFDFLDAEILNGSLVFVALDTNRRMRRLWVSDGTTEGTHPLLDAGQHPVDGAAHLTVLGSSLVFRAFGQDEPFQPTLWVSDGTAAGTHQIASDAEGAPSRPEELTALGTTVFFTAEAAENEYLRYLWQSDGTPEGTRRLEMSTGPLPAHRLRAVGQRLLFLVPEIPVSGGIVTGEALWTTDGTPAGTRRLASNLHHAFSAVQVGATLFLIEDNPLLFPWSWLTPMDLPDGFWRSDGSTEGTVPLPLPLPEALPRRVEAVAGHLLLTTRNEERGNDLWALDEDGEVVARIGRFTAIEPGFIRIGRRLWFVATTPETGTEPWVVDLPADFFEARRLREP